MKKIQKNSLVLLLGICITGSLVLTHVTCTHITDKQKSELDARMAWWREARFGMFIHWGLYAIPAGEWKGDTQHAEWIRTTAQIPLETYNRFLDQFNPVRFDAHAWVSMAREAGMKYIVITSKHHDGFCLFDSKYTDFDVMSTPFHRDILKELADACHEQGIRICWYHSIMDWHHPDYLPRRGWEKNRPTEGADFNRYITYLKNQVTELLTSYGKIGVLWFDGEWESTWNHTYGQDLYNTVRSLQPNIIVNNRVDVGRSGMAGLTREGNYAGDFGTPEQEIPPTGLSGVDWETCMTMNRHWGFNKYDTDFKSSGDLIRKLADIASKGGNFLLNVGPTPLGEFPQTSIDRLRDIGKWMKTNGESIYGTNASPFKHLDWGRCTLKKIRGGNRLYLHVFDWPEDGKLVVPGIFNTPVKAYLLSDPGKEKNVDRKEDALVIAVPEEPPDPFDSVIALDVKGNADVNDPPDILSEYTLFVDTCKVIIQSDRENVELRYTLDGTTPHPGSALADGPIQLTGTTAVTGRIFRNGRPVSGPVQKTFTRVKPEPAVPVVHFKPGIQYAYFEGDWDIIPDFRKLQPARKGILPNFSFTPRTQDEYFGFQYSGFIQIPKDGVYAFYTDSDDGSRLYIGNELVVDNDGLHGMQEKEGVIALAAGMHPIRVTFFEKTGGDDLKVYFKGPGIEKQPIPENILLN
jgi:alpha-L-fucosidase